MYLGSRIDDYERYCDILQVRLLLCWILGGKEYLNYYVLLEFDEIICWVIDLNKFKLLVNFDFGDEVDIDDVCIYMRIDEYYRDDFLMDC